MTAPTPRPDGAALARELGTTAFAAYVVLACDAERRDDGRLLVVVSARRLAARLGVGKDTAAEALRRLSAAGLLLDAPRQDERTGRFAVAVRELLSVAGIGPCRHSEDRAVESASSRRRRTECKVPDGQLDLFAASCDEEEPNDESLSFKPQDRRSQLHRNQDVRVPRLDNQCLEADYQAIRKQAARGQTRLHRGCDDVAGDVPVLSPEGRPC